MSLVAHVMLSLSLNTLSFVADKLVNLDCYYLLTLVIIIHYYRICLLVLLFKLYRVLSTVGLLALLFSYNLAHFRLTGFLIVYYKYVYVFVYACKI